MYLIVRLSSSFPLHHLSHYPLLSSYYERKITLYLSLFLLPFITTVSITFSYTPTASAPPYRSSTATPHTCTHPHYGRPSLPYSLPSLLTAAAPLVLLAAVLLTFMTDCLLCYWPLRFIGSVTLQFPVFLVYFISSFQTAEFTFVSFLAIAERCKKIT